MVDLVFKRVAAGDYQAVLDDGSVFRIRHGVPTRHDWSVHFQSSPTAEWVMHPDVKRGLGACKELARVWDPSISLGVAENGPVERSNGAGSGEHPSGPEIVDLGLVSPCCSEPVSGWGGVFSCPGCRRAFTLAGG